MQFILGKKSVFWELRIYYDVHFFFVEKSFIFETCTKNDNFFCSLWNVFVDAACHSDNPDSAMIQAISELPLPNRDTLAYLIIHLQTVAENYTVNKMGKDNLSMILAPTVVGNSSSDPMAILQEKDSQMAVMSNLMSISSDYWLKFLEQKEQNVFGYLKSSTPEVNNR